MQDTYFDSKEFREILQRYEDALEQNENVFLDSEELTSIAEYYQAQGDTAKGLAAAEYALELYSGATAPLLFKARVTLLHDNDPQKALEIVEQIDDKTDLDYYYLKAEIMIVENHNEAADLYLEESLEEVADSDRPDFLLDTATLFADYEQTDLAEKWLLKSDETTHPDYRELKARIHYLRGEYAESEEILNGLIDEAPYSALYWDLLATVQLAQDRCNDSMTSSEYAIAINPSDDEALLNKANVLMRLNNFEEALRYYERYSEVCPMKEAGELYQGECLLNLERLREASFHLLMAEKMARKESPLLPEIYQYLAFCFCKSGNTDEALAFIDKTKDLACNHHEMLVVRGHVLLSGNRMEEATQCFSEAMVESGGSNTVMMRIAMSLYDNNYLDMAYDLLTDMMEKNDHQLNYGYAYLAICAHDLGKREEYLQHLKTAVERDPQEAKAVLGPLFPDDIEPEDFYQYATQQP